MDDETDWIVFWLLFVIMPILLALILLSGCLGGESVCLGGESVYYNEERVGTAYEWNDAQQVCDKYNNTPDPFWLGVKETKKGYECFPHY